MIIERQELNATEQDQSSLDRNVTQPNFRLLTLSPGERKYGPLV